MKHAILVGIAAALAVGGAVLRSQDLLAATPSAPATAPPRDQGCRDDGTRIGTWAAAPHFKCGFAAGAFTVVPYLGEHAPRSLPWTWRTTAATIGDVDLRAGQPLREHHDDAQFTATAGVVVERWQFGADGVAQSFSIAARPGAGDLVVRGAVTGELQAAPVAPHVGRLVFRDEVGRTELHYGAALAIDAEGRRFPVTTAYDGRAIELRLAADAVAAARFPLLLDPLLTVYVFDSLAVTQGNGITEANVAHVDAPDRQSLVRTEIRWASNSDSDLLVWKCRDDFAYTQLVYSELDPATYSHGGTVAAVGNNASYVVAWARGSITSTGIKWFTLPADGGGQLVVRSVTRPAGTSDRTPRVAGRRGDVPGWPAHALLVWLRETAAGTDRTELWGGVLDCAAGTSGAAIQFADGGTVANPVDNDQPWIGRDGFGPYHEWAVAYQTFVASANVWSVRVRSVMHDGALGHLSTPPVQGGHHAMQPRVEGSGGRWLLAYATAPSAFYPGKLTTYGGSNVWSQRFHWEITQPVWDHAATNLAASFSRDLMIGGIAHDTTTKSHWLVAHGPAAGNPTVQLLGFRGRVVRSATLPDPGGSATHMFVPASLAFDETLDRFAVLYVVRSVAAGATTHHVYGGRLDHPTMVPFATYGSDCGGGSFFHRPFWLGAEFASLGVAAGQANVPAALGLSLQPAWLPLAALGLPGGCSLLLDAAPGAWMGLVPLVTNAQGDARADFAVPENLGAFDFRAQWFVFQGNGDVAATAGGRIEVR